MRNVKWLMAAGLVAVTAGCVETTSSGYPSSSYNRGYYNNGAYASNSGGYYASDLLSGTYLVGGSYTYHMTDETAVEFAGWYTHANADLIRALESDRGVVLADTYARMLFAESLLVWSPVYGKLRLGGSIIHFDLHADLGVGVIDSKTSRGAAGVIGFGIKLFLGQAVAFRVDARNRTFRQELLDERFLVNDSAITASLSLFLPFSN